MWIDIHTYVQSQQTHPFRCVLPPYLHMRPYTSSYSHRPHMSEQVPIWPSPITHLTHLISPHLIVHSKLTCIHNTIMSEQCLHMTPCSSPHLTSPHTLNLPSGAWWCMGQQTVHSRMSQSMQETAQHSQSTDSQGQWGYQHSSHYSMLAQLLG